MSHPNNANANDANEFPCIWYNPDTNSPHNISKDDSIFKRHYRVKIRGGLRACVKSVGEKWEGRAHNGLIDSINTAKIVRNMVQSGFCFTMTTRGLDNNGIPFGKFNTR